MALATQCPHCHTTFRVAHDQLKLRAGLVRCGACKQIFNGIENLLPPDETEPGAESVAPAAAPESAATAEMPAPSPPEETPTAPEADPPPPQDAAPAAESPVEEAGAGQQAGPEHTTPVAPDPADPLLRMTLMDFTHVERGLPEPPQSPDTETADPVAEAIDDLQQKPWRSAEKEGDDTDSDADELDQVDEREYEEPDFVKQSRRRERIGRMFRLVTAVGLPLLLIGLIAQGTYAFRSQLAARFPQLRPVLVSACRQFGCKVGLPAQIDYVSLESSELQTLSADKNTFGLALLLLNRSPTVEAWPNIELTLNDADERPLLRRVFRPDEYLPAGQTIDKGFAPKSEQPVKLYFSLTKMQASGYRVYLFYP